MYYFWQVLAEQESVLGSNGMQNSLDFESVGKMEFLQDCIKESLRLFPPLILLMRMAMTDIETTLRGPY